MQNWDERMELWRQPMWGVRIPATPLSTILQSGFRRTLMCRTKSNPHYSCRDSGSTAMLMWRSSSYSVASHFHFSWFCAHKSHSSPWNSDIPNSTEWRRTARSSDSTKSCTVHSGNTFLGSLYQNSQLATSALELEHLTFCKYELVIRIFAYDQLTVLGQTGSSSTVQIDIF